MRLKITGQHIDLVARGNIHVAILDVCNCDYVEIPGCCVCDALEGITVLKFSNLPQPPDLPLPAEPWQALFAGEEFLHGALFEVAFFCEELLQGVDEGIRIAQRLGDGFLFGFGGWEGDLQIANIVDFGVSYR